MDSSFYICNNGNSRRGRGYITLIPKWNFIQRLKALFTFNYKEEGITFTDWQKGSWDWNSDKLQVQIIMTCAKVKVLKFWMFYVFKFLINKKVYHLQNDDTKDVFPYFSLWLVTNNNLCLNIYHDWFHTVHNLVACVLQRTYIALW